MTPRPRCAVPLVTVLSSRTIRPDVRLDERQRGGSIAEVIGGQDRVRPGFRRIPGIPRAGLAGGVAQDQKQYPDSERDRISPGDL
jgi:hypothetical protein